MPLRAIIAGTDTLAFEQSPQDWRALQRRLRNDRSIGRLPCCDAQAVAKTSKLGTQFFAHHRKRACDASRETETHLNAKRAVFEGCVDAGWRARTEAVGPEGSWRADVLAWRETAQVAFEIQWSPQSEATTRERQRGFARHGVRCCWLFRRLPFAGAVERVPAFRLVEVSDQSLPVVDLGARTHSLREFARLMLEERVNFVAAVRVRVESVRLRMLRDRCPRCSATVHFADASLPPLVSVCGLSLGQVTECAEVQRLHKDWGRKLRSLYAEDFEDVPVESSLIAGLVRRSPPGETFKTAMGRSGFCPSCLNVVPFTEVSAQLPVTAEVHAHFQAPEWPVTRFPHWCVGDNGTYCSTAGLDITNPRLT